MRSVYVWFHVCHCLHVVRVHLQLEELKSTGSITGCAVPLQSARYSFEPPNTYYFANGHKEAPEDSDSLFDLDAAVEQHARELAQAGSSNTDSNNTDSSNNSGNNNSGNNSSNNSGSNSTSNIETDNATHAFNRFGFVHSGNTSPVAPCTPPHVI